MTVTSTMVINTHRIFLGFKFLVRNEEKKKFLVEEQGKFEEFLGLHFYLIYPKSEQTGAPIFPKKKLYIVRKQFLTPPYNFYALIFFGY